MLRSLVGSEMCIRDRAYDVKNGGKINIFNVNVQRVDANVLAEYKDKGVFGDPYDGDENAKKRHEVGVSDFTDFEDVFFNFSVSIRISCPLRSR